jgi:hypothetical protein
MQDSQLYFQFHNLPFALKEKVLVYIQQLKTEGKGQKKTEKMHPKAGCMKGTFVASPDFDDPLEDFKDYM